MTASKRAPATLAENVNEAVGHPSWCDPALCTADPAATSMDGYRAGAGGEHRSAQVPLDLRAAMWLPALTGAAWLTESVAPWKCSAYLRVQVGDADLSMTVDHAGPISTRFPHSWRRPAPPRERPDERHPICPQHLGGCRRGHRRMVVVLAHGARRIALRGAPGSGLRAAVQRGRNARGLRDGDDGRQALRPPGPTGSSDRVRRRVLASIAANIAAAEPTSGARIVAAWPALALLLVVEMLSRSGRGERQSAAARETEPPAQVPAVSDAVIEVPPEHPEHPEHPAEVPPTESNGRQPSRSRQPTAVTRQLATEIIATEPGITRMEVAARIGVSARRLREVLAAEP